MNKEYNQSQIIRFFHQFSKLENRISREQVHHIINNPTAKARFKVKKITSLKLIIMTFLTSISVILVLFFSKPDDKLKLEKSLGSNTVSEQIAIPQKFKKAEISIKNDSDISVYIADPEQNNLSKVGVIANQQSTKNKPEKLVYEDSIIEGNKFIIELTNSELEKLGFQIHHYTVFYRNSYHDKNIFYLATHSNGRICVRGDSIFYNMEDYYGLQTDTLPDAIHIKQMRMIRRQMRLDPKTVERNDKDYLQSHHSFYPLFNTHKTGEITAIDKHLNFDALADTLLPVVIKFSQLNVVKKQDQFFWFITNNDFYDSLPERYAWVKDEFEAIKAKKKERDNPLKVHFGTDDYNKHLLIPDGEMLEGKGNIAQLSKEELALLGIFSNEKYGWSYCHKTRYRGSASGLKRVQGLYVPDTIFNVDYYIKYTTDCFGDFMATKNTILKMDNFMNDNDVLFPVQTENKNGNIYWFTLSEKFWKAVPEKYTYLKEHYAKVLYNKSFYPNRDFVRYFNEPFDKVGLRVSSIALNKSELEKVGFKFSGGGMEINCGFGENWINYSNRSYTQGSNAKSYIYEDVDYISPHRRFVRKEWSSKFDSLYQTANKGFQFVYVTDTLGRHIHKIYIKKQDVEMEGVDYKYLIPILVRQSEIFNPNAENRVFWFTPTDAFFSRLPERIKNDIRKEYEIISSNVPNTESPTCTYFESCRSTLKVENMKVYPNPTQNRVTIEFDVYTSLTGAIFLANIAGQQVKMLNSNVMFNVGFNSTSYDLGGIKPGIYLLSIVTSEGFVTERVIISE